MRAPSQLHAVEKASTGDVVKKYDTAAETLPQIDASILSHDDFDIISVDSRRQFRELDVTLSNCTTEELLILGYDDRVEAE